MPLEKTHIVLHTSDWHLGRTLYSKKQRYDEHEKFLNWLINVVKEKLVDTLIIAGDIFDTTTPSSRAQGLYYGFLIRIKSTNCRHVIVIAGNHDSPSLIDAPKELLAALNVLVVGNMPENLENEVFVLKDEQGNPEYIIGAVPYLRERDLRISVEGESMVDKEHKIVEGIRLHYEQIAQIAETKRVALKVQIPLIVTGHLFAVGGQTNGDDGVRDIYVGNLGGVSAATFPELFDYVALGHLHFPQKVNQQEHIRYSGAPLPMGFGECKQQKQVNIITFENRKPTVEVVKIPLFQKIESIEGDKIAILKALDQLGKSNTSVWVEVRYVGEEIWGNMTAEISEIIENYPLVELIRYKNQKLFNATLTEQNENEFLEELDVNEVFQRCLDTYSIPEEQQNEFLLTYREIINQMNENDHLGT
ncbi:MAG: exonuclease SbcCD subunit D C-terminal domain-containing protein [Bacteroidales bacterium]|jgi:exonuclease SbcD|nr:exonuclease SbcCD subunit D C-terminal domain-containing protein [Bacteroidales bacterium]